MLRKASVSVLALVACTSLAAAADFNGPSYRGSLKDDDAAPAAHSWTGFYVGVNGGYARGDGTVDPGHDTEFDGWAGSGQIGYNLQLGQILIGIEADYQWPISRTASSSCRQVDLRACGGTSVRPDSDKRRPGRSPRVRRNPRQAVRLGDRVGSISARAEEPLTPNILELLNLSKSCVH